MDEEEGEGDGEGEGEGVECTKGAAATATPDAAACTPTITGQAAAQFLPSELPRPAPLSSHRTVKTNT